MTASSAQPAAGAGNSDLQLAPLLDLVRAGRIAEADALVGELIMRKPGEAEIWYHSGGIGRLVNKPDRAIQHLRKAIALDPQNARYRYELGRMLFDMGRFDAAVATLKAVTRKGPLQAKALALLGVALTRVQAWEDALPVFDAAIALDPADREAPAHKAAAQHVLEQRNGALPGPQGRYRPPGNPPPPAPMVRPGDVGGGAPSRPQPVGSAPAGPTPAVNAAKAAEKAAAALIRQDRPADDIPALRTRVHTQAQEQGAASLPPLLQEIADGARNPVGVMKELSRQFFDLNELPIALRCSEAAYKLAPKDPSVLMNLGVMNRRLGNIKTAFVLFEEAVKLEPENPIAWNNVGNMHSDIGNKPKAEEAYKKALSLDPNLHLAASNVCRVLLESGKTDEAAEIAARLLRIPNLPASLMPFPLSVAQNVSDMESTALIHDRLWDAMDTIPAERIDAILLSLLPCVRTDEDYRQLMRQQVRWGDHVQLMADRDPIPGERPRRRKLKKTDVLKVAFLSSDLRSHNVAKFLMPIFQMHDKSKIAIHCYSSWPGAADHVQREIARMCAAFVPVGTITLNEAGKKIIDDRMDMVIEFNGITRYSLAKALAHRLAPVQAEWLGYPFTLGMRECDYMVVDPYMKPTSKACMRDEPLEMPKSWIVFDPDDQFGIGFGEIPIDLRPPVERNGYVTFGVTNKPYKFNEICYETWAEVVKAVPGSKLCMLRPECNGKTFKANVIKNFARVGIGEERLRFIGNAPGQHMIHYNEIDIGLDTFPQVGGTTTTESLWMGLPVVSLVGREIFERMGLSILTNVGIPDCAVMSRADYVAKAAELAADVPRLRDLRRDLRDMIRSSPLCMAEQFVRDFETMLWRACR